MAIQTLPDGWTLDQLTALNELAAMRDTYMVLRDVKQLLADTSPEAQRVMDDMRKTALEVWNRVKAYPPPA